ncbi:Daunorubicin/doxorubicin resistance ATP-binding protein DrrA [Methylacidimicrobium cyclopophantes]|uniref:Daunorubicin/doxorubicin resistance ATP-binding protein DrrA n=1 Tax=Methylacidimicrobium cyclopophantes TaxID=1041766 RepID=A0A5E6MKN0_9BACT|nr:ATP-binding cassette domain-containing protein [Methylacidimicrobium cyclopophantes]VVM08539.1 Daunorubicin/doxorubicin resistance ATP-binding protein DrrA [Methylacidimicrobium cyclopophantes]
MAGNDSSSFAVETDQLSRRFGGFCAVDRLTLQVRLGAIFGLLGPNGSGKTTTMRMLTTLLPPSSGSARVDGHDVVGDPTAVRADIGYVPQMLSADPDLTGYENLWIGAKLYRIPRSERRERIEEALDFMGIDQPGELVRRYSGGMIRRLEIAQSLVSRPRVLFLDEPTVGLDPAARRTLWRHLRELRKQWKMTIFLTTHYMEEAAELCGTVGFLRAGRLMHLGSPEQLCHAGGRQRSLEELFLEIAGEPNPSDGNSYAEVVRSRKAIRRHG